MPGPGPGSATASTRRQGPQRAPSPTWQRRTRILPSPPSTSRNGTSMDTLSASETVNLELDDLQGGVLHPRPSPYVGTYLLLRIDDRRAGRELVRRLHPVVGAGRPASDPTRGAWVTVAFTYQGLQALGVPQASLDSFAPEFRQGMAARAAELGDVGDSSPANWEKPLGTSDVHVAVAAITSSHEGLEAAAEQARQAREQLPG